MFMYNDSVLRCMHCSVISALNLNKDKNKKKTCYFIVLFIRTQNNVYYQRKKYF